MTTDNNPSNAISIQPSREEDEETRIAKYWKQYANNPMLQRALRGETLPKPPTTKQDDESTTIECIVYATYNRASQTRKTFNSPKELKIYCAYEGQSEESKKEPLFTTEGSMITALCFHEGILYTGDDHGEIFDAGTIQEPKMKEEKPERVIARLEHRITGLSTWTPTIKGERKSYLIASSLSPNGIRTILPKMEREDDLLARNPIGIFAICVGRKNEIYITGIVGEIIRIDVEEGGVIGARQIRQEQNMLTERGTLSIAYEDENIICVSKENEIFKCIYSPPKSSAPAVYNFIKTKTRPQRVRALCFYDGKLIDGCEDGNIYETRTGRIIATAPQGEIITAMCTTRIEIKQSSSSSTP